MPFSSPRAISILEIEVIAAALSRAQIRQPHRITLESIRSLRVHSTCKCGCASIGFLREGEPTPNDTRLLADGQGLSAAGEEVGVLVFGTEDSVIEMEVYWYKTAGAPLPLPASIGEFQAHAMPSADPHP